MPIPFFFPSAPKSLSPSPYLRTHLNTPTPTDALPQRLPSSGLPRRQHNGPLRIRHPQPTRRIRMRQLLRTHARASLPGDQQRHLRGMRCRIVVFCRRRSFGKQRPPLRRGGGEQDGALGGCEGGVRSGGGRGRRREGRHGKQHPIDPGARGVINFIASTQRVEVGAECLQRLVVSAIIINHRHSAQQQNRANMSFMRLDGVKQLRARHVLLLRAALCPQHLGEGAYNIRC
ncbi:hypothetical protein HDK90DRAFT_474843 [Phyllosticta capitalensis]|uniref:Uncharacterized protein n=1 Tax=Phyllosticta capitalensis TaxID=121624 RepID=A0ABR1YXH0_9PEZI